MKKSKLLIFLPILSFCFVSCKKEEEVDPFANGIFLKKDKNANYVLDDVSNANGSASYEIFVRSFYDSNNDGIGDFNGVKAKLPYLKSLGIKTIWLMPIHPSPTYHGYDVIDYYKVNVDYGTMADFESLIQAAKEQNMDIMMDLVLNHSSNLHPWMSSSYNDFMSGNTGEDSKADWYNWSTSHGCKYKDLYYEGSFNSSMPDLNLDSPTLRKEIEKIVKFWLEKGVSGFRLDAITYYYSNNVSKNVEFLNWLDQTAKKYNPNVYMVGEAWTNDVIIQNYYASNGKKSINSFFNFGSAAGSTNISLSLINAAKGILRAKQFSSAVQDYETKIKIKNPNCYSSYFVSNHDMDRMSAFFKDYRSKTIASLYLLLPGTPFMYYGEEIEMKGARVTSPDDYSDVRRRLPMIWSKSDKSGECKFPERNRLDLDGNEQVELGVNDKLNENYSLLNHYRKVINVRNKYPFMKMGAYTDMVKLLNDETDKVLAYKISYGDEYVIVVHNFSDYNLKVTSPGEKIVDTINTSRQIPELKDGILSIGHHSTVLLK